MKCFVCRGQTEKKRKTYVATPDNCVFIVKNVPAIICIQCGEVYYVGNVAEKLEKIVEKLRGLSLEMAVIEYT